jgi:hypothetical protein
MADRFLNGKLAHVSLWSGLTAAFLFVSAPKIYRGATTYSFQPGKPFHSSDSFLRFGAGVTNASGQLIAIFDSIPASKSVIIFMGKGDTRGSLLAMTVAYLAWPHPVQFTEINASNPGVELRAFDSALAAALVFCGVNRPPSIHPAIVLGTDLEVVPISRDER